ncbi:hypothetical protein Hypma_003957 [Hypsizygus marmoreus]|uniref:Uncharacterized protein n=1 Tax=Hypsizygus marmoreus TaxID=39966 RepID=A0A369J7J3_HYPMA|nr:hypothetical protein Hypma_003957 [Hypsizygus marmoreus]
MSYASPKNKSKRPSGTTLSTLSLSGAGSLKTEFPDISSPQSTSSQHTCLLFSSLHAHASTPKGTSSQHNNNSQATFELPNYVSRTPGGSNPPYSPRTPIRKKRHRYIKSIDVP